MRRFFKFLIFTLCCLLLLFNSLCFAHPGRLDGNGGHYNRSTGEYHYHSGSNSSSSDSNRSSYSIDRNTSYPSTNSERSNRFVEFFKSFNLAEWVRFFIFLGPALFLLCFFLIGLFSLFYLFFDFLKNKIRSMLLFCKKVCKNSRLFNFISSYGLPGITLTSVLALFILILIVALLSISYGVDFN